MSNKKKEKSGFMELLRDRKWYLLLLTFFWGMILMLRNPFNPAVGFVQEDMAYNYSVAAPITGLVKGTILEQHIIGEHNFLSSVSYTTATGERENTGTLYVKLTDAQTGELIAEHEKAVSALPNMGMETLRFPSIADSKGKEYILTMTADTEDAEHCIMIMGSETDKLEPALVNGNPVELSIRSMINYHETGGYWVRILAYMLVYVLGVILVLFMNGTDAKSYLMFASVIGILFMFIMPFPHILDESTHFFRSFMISQGNILDDVNENGDIGGYVSDNYGSVIDQDLNIDAFINDRDDWMQTYSDEKSFYRNPYMSSYIPLNHLPGAVGIWLANLLHLPAIFCIIFGRFITLLCYLAMTYVAIKEANYYRQVYFVVAGLPIALFLAASFSADPLLIGSSLMVISICLKYRFDPSQMISVRELIYLLIGVMLIASSKYLIYLPILLLFFLIPKKCFCSRKIYILEIVLAVLIIVVFAIAAVWLLKQFNYVEDRNGHVNMGEQISFLLNNKFTGLGYLIYSFFENLNSNLLYIGTQRKDLYPIMLVILASVFTEKPYQFENGRKKVQMCALFIGISFIIYAFTVGALYLAYTPVGQPWADGVQPRYMFPILPLMMMTLGFCLPAEPKMGKVDRKIAFCLLLICLDCLSYYMMNAFI